MYRDFINKHMTSVAIICFLVLYSLIIAYKPSFLYNSDGSLREFGVGQSRKTVVPAWLLAIVIGIMSYFAIIYYVTAPRLNY
jgi:uncharacterized membrane protein YozB (DUF420 family)